MLNYLKVKYFLNVVYCKNLFFNFTNIFNNKTLINLGSFNSYTISFIFTQNTFFDFSI